MNFLPAESVVQRTGLTSKQLSELEAVGVVQAVVKNGKKYYSNHDLYRIKGILHFTKKCGMSLSQAQEKLDAVRQS